MRVNSARRKSRGFKEGREEIGPIIANTRIVLIPSFLLIPFNEQDAKPALDTRRSEEFAFCATRHG